MLILIYSIQEERSIKDFRIVLDHNSQKLYHKPSVHFLKAYSRLFNLEILLFTHESILTNDINHAAASSATFFSSFSTSLRTIHFDDRKDDRNRHNEEDDENDRFIKEIPIFSKLNEFVIHTDSFSHTAHELVETKTIYITSLTLTVINKCDFRVFENYTNIQKLVWNMKLERKSWISCVYLFSLVFILTGTIFANFQFKGRIVYQAISHSLLSFKFTTLDFYILVFTFGLFIYSLKLLTNPERRVWISMCT